MTLTELLVALMIVALIAVALFVGVGSAVKVYRDATRLYEAETLCGTILTCLEDEFRFARNIRDDGTFDSQTFGSGVKVGVDGEGKVRIGAADDPNSALLSDGAYTSGLKASEPVIARSVDAGGQVLIDITVEVASEDTRASVKHTVKVAPLNQ